MARWCWSREGAARWAAAAVDAALGFGVVRLFAYVNKYAVDIFFRDEWDYFRPLFEHDPEWHAFAWQHGPHRMGVGMLLMQALLTVSHWNSRVIAFAAAAIYMLAAVLALWLKRRVAGPLSVFDAGIPMLFLVLGHYETWVGATNLSHGPLPLLMAVGFALLLTVRSDWICATGAGLLVALAVYTGFAVFIAVVALALFPVLAVRAWPRRAAAALYALAFLLTLGSLASFFVGYRIAPAVECFVFPDPHPFQYVRFLGGVLSRPLGLGRNVGFQGWVQVAVALAALVLVTFAPVRVVRGRARDPLWLAIASLGGFSLLFGVNSALGRVCLGTDGATASRYVPYAIAGIFAAYLAVATLRSPPWLRPAALSLFVAASLARDLVQRLRPDIENLHQIKSKWRDCYLPTHDIDRCQRESSFGIYRRPEATHLLEKLDFLEQNHFNLFSR